MPVRRTVPAPSVTVATVPDTSPSTLIVIHIGSSRTHKYAVPLKVVFQIPVLQVIFMYEQSTNIYLPPVKPYILKHNSNYSPILNILKFYEDPDYHYFPSNYEHAIQTAILADFLCCPSYLRKFEEIIGCECNCLVPKNVFLNVRRVICDAYQVYWHRMKERQNVTCFKCNYTVAVPPPPQRIYSPPCCPDIFWFTTFRHCSLSIM